ncbi:hypothetical protein Hanom_Chr12g01100541 [Helianthus anomalus]
MLRSNLILSKLIHQIRSRNLLLRLSRIITRRRSASNSATNNLSILLLRHRSRSR